MDKEPSCLCPFAVLEDPLPQGSFSRNFGRVSPFLFGIQLRLYFQHNHGCGTRSQSPPKTARLIVSGQIYVPVAIFSAFVLGLGSLGIALWLKAEFGFIVLAYISLNLS